MAVRTDSFDLGALRLSAGEGRRLELGVEIDALELAAVRYRVSEAPASDTEPPGADRDSRAVPVLLDISRTTGAGYALRLRFGATLSGPCMRCLNDAIPHFEIEAREVSLPGGGEELSSPYLDEKGLLDLRRWARDALALALPASIVCRPECAGLCPECGADLNAEGPEHRHAAAPDPRWAELSKLRFE